MRNEPIEYVLTLIGEPIRMDFFLVIYYYQIVHERVTINGLLFWSFSSCLPRSFLSLYMLLKRVKEQQRQRDQPFQQQLDQPAPQRRPEQVQQQQGQPVPQRRPEQDHPVLFFIEFFLIIVNEMYLSFSFSVEDLCLTPYCIKAGKSIRLVHNDFDHFFFLL